jgi:hypothetical protein
MRYRLFAECFAGVVLVTLVGTGIVQYRRAYQVAVAAEAVLKEATEAPLSGRVPVLLGRASNGAMTPGPEGTNLILVYSESCGQCTVNWPQWVKVREAARANGIHVSFLTLSHIDTESYRQTHGIASTLSSPDPTTLLSYRLRYTPQTILVGPENDVRGVWTGVLADHEVNDIDTAMRAVRR